MSENRRDGGANQGTCKLLGECEGLLLKGGNGAGKIKRISKATEQLAMKFEAYKEALRSLYQELCADERLQEMHKRTRLCFSATEWGDCFSTSSPKILCLGKANNGASVPSQLDVQELFEGEESIMKNEGGLKWIAETWELRRESGWYPKHSPFFRVMRSIAENLCAQYGWEKSDWYKHIAYGNFGKCNIDGNASPSMRIYAGREDIFVRMLKVDLEYLNPDFVVCFTGSGKSTLWFSNMFLKKLDAVEGESVEWDGAQRYCIRVYWANGKCFLVTEHPQRKPEIPHVKTVCREIVKISEANHIIKGNC